MPHSACLSALVARRRRARCSRVYIKRRERSPRAPRGKLNEALLMVGLVTRSFNPFSVVVGRLVVRVSLAVVVVVDLLLDDEQHAQREPHQQTEAGGDHPLVERDRLDQSPPRASPRCRSAKWKRLIAEPPASKPAFRRGAGRILDDATAGRVSSGSARDLPRSPPAVR